MSVAPIVMDWIGAERGGGGDVPLTEYVEGDLTSYVEGDFDLIPVPRVPRRLRALRLAPTLLNLYCPCTRVSVRLFLRCLRRSGARAEILYPYSEAVSSSMPSSAVFLPGRRGAVHVMLPCEMTHDFRYHRDWFECFHFGAVIVAVQVHPPQFAPAWDVFMYRLESGSNLYGAARAPSQICRSSVPSVL